jgi:6-phosphogluconate dehydrogenase (decarboxylating)
MELGLIGLGRMGANMARRLRRADINVAAFNRSLDVTEALAEETGLTATTSVEQLVALLPVPRVVWLMLPAGAITQQYVDQLIRLLNQGDILIDGANSYYKDSMRRAGQLAEQAECGDWRMVMRSWSVVKQKPCTMLNPFSRCLPLQLTRVGFVVVRLVVGILPK